MRVGAGCVSESGRVVGIQQGLEQAGDAPNVPVPRLAFNTQHGKWYAPAEGQGPHLVQDGGILEDHGDVLKGVPLGHKLLGPVEDILVHVGGPALELQQRRRGRRCKSLAKPYG